MATVKGINVKGYCDAMDTELAGMKDRINALREDAKRTYGADSELFHTHERHLVELADFIDWKLQILMKACPFDWQGADKDIESTVSVGPAEKTPGTDFSGGYLGG